ncbi:MAG TPA: hypothetical protein VM684_07835 [Gaiellales bacterium]|jgi:hypothetical protein|nr:hypothetical protein [Gaiellales bacterium]
MPAKRLDIVWIVLAIAATVLGVWLGVAGADISPVFTEAPLGAVGGPGR